MSTAPVDEPTAMSFTIPLTGNTIVATAAVVTTYSASADCADSATPTCSGDICVMMSCGGGSFTPDGAYDSLRDNVKPMMKILLSRCLPERRCECLSDGDERTRSLRGGCGNAYTISSVCTLSQYKPLHGKTANGSRLKDRLDKTDI